MIKLPISTPSRVLFTCFVFLMVVIHGGSIASGLYLHMDTARQTADADEIERSIASIKRRLLAHEDGMQALFLPEGGFFCNIFYGYSLVNLALQTREGGARERTCIELEGIIQQADSYKMRHPFNYPELSTPGGIIFAGSMNRLLAGYALLGGGNPALLEQFHEYSEVIAGAFKKSNPPFPESFPGLSWPVDGISALDSLRLHDLLYKTNYYVVKDSWLSWLKANIDPESNLMVAQVDPATGQVLDGARGCAMSWSLALLPGIVDPQFVDAQYAIFKRDWFVPFGPGLLGVREWYRGIAKPTSYLPGPVVGELGAAATGLGIAATRANGDFKSWHLMLRGLEAFGMPLSTKYGEKTYFLSQALLCDVLALWGKTIVPWSAPAMLPKTGLSDSMQFGIALCSLIVILCLVAASLLLLVRRLCDKAQIVCPPKGFMFCSCAIQCGLIVLWLFTPMIGTFQVFTIMLIVVLLEFMTIRPSLLARGMLGDAGSQVGQQPPPVE